MKAILILAVSLFALSATARTGTKHFSYSVSADTEAQVLNKVEMTIPLIISGKVKSVWQRHAGCYPNNSRFIKVQGVSTKKTYKVDSYGNLSPWFTASIRYFHKKCNVGSDR
ncbi:MAG: hypothetical protein ACJAS4_001612 [Bacteriovoracaceae bacterium]|jgi:hypothetical protein